MLRKGFLWILILMAAFALSGCKKRVPDPPSDIEKRSCDSLNGMLAQGGVSLDEKVFAEGKGSLRVTSEMPMTVKLYEIGFPGVDNADLIYKAKIKTQDLAGSVSLQMVVKFPSGGEFPAQQETKTSPGGTSDWTECQVTLPIQPGQKPSKVGLNLIYDAMGGSAWIDDIHLVKVPK